MAGEQETEGGTPQEGAAATPPAGSPPADNKGQAAGAGGSNGSQKDQDGAGGKQPLPKGAQVELFKLRDRIRGQNDELETSRSKIADLEARLEAVESKGKQGMFQQKKADIPDPMTDPAGYLEHVEKSVLEKAVAARKAEDAVVAHEQAAVETEKWLLSRSHLKEDANFAKAVADQIAVMMRRAPQSDPAAVGKAAYLDVCEALGVTPDFSRPATTREVNAGATRRPTPGGSAHAPRGGSGAGGISSPEEFQKALKDGIRPGTPEWKNLKEQVKQAQREGRWQGKTLAI